MTLPKGIYFYGGPFSNFVGYPIRTPKQLPACVPEWMADRVYPLNEYLFQAAKAVRAVDHDYVLKAPGPWVAKQRGRNIDLRPDWDIARYEVMLFGLRLKFEHPELRKELLLTGELPIFEDSPTDFIWGYRNNGLNLLGKALEQVRGEIRRELQWEHGLKCSPVKCHFSDPLCPIRSILQPPKGP